MTSPRVSPGSPLGTLETPAALVDLDRLDRNIGRMAAYAQTHSLALRPHIKTHKATAIAAAQLAHGAAGLTCATPAEAGVMSAVCDDILLAYPAIGPEARPPDGAAARTSRSPSRSTPRGPSTTSPRAARAADRPVRVYVELDVGMHRVGVAAWDEAIALARRVRRQRAARYAGHHVLSRPHSRRRSARRTPSLRRWARRSHARPRRSTTPALAPEVVSGGSTPTVWRTHEIGGITEMRPGHVRVQRPRHRGDRRVRAGGLRAHRARDRREHERPEPGGDRCRRQGARARADARRRGRRVGLHCSTGPRCSSRG